MAFGKKMGSVKALKQSLKKGSSNSQWIKYIPKEKDGGSITVRFLQEVEEWVNYIEVFDPTIRRGYPLPDDQTAKGYDEELRKSSRYLVNAINIDDDRVIPLQLPKDLVNQLVVMAEKYGTITDRDYELVRSGEGLDTKYSALPESPLPRKLDKYTPHDLEQVLEEAYLSVWGDEDEDDDDEADAAPRRKPDLSKRRPAKLPVDDVDDDDDDDDIPVDDDDDTEPDDDEPEADDADDEDDAPADDDDYYTEAELKAMPIGELRAIAKDAGYATRGLKAAQIIDLLINGEPEDDEDDDEAF